MPKPNFLGTREFVTHSLPHVHGRTLDLGAGTAKYKPIILEKASTYTAFDLFSGPNIDVVGDILHTGFPDGSFETVFCTQVFEHIPQPWLAALEIKRLLATGGVAIVTAPFLQASHADPHDYFRYTMEGMKSLFANEGFEILDNGMYGKTCFVLFDFIKLRWFNPYATKQSPGSVRMARYLAKWGFTLDRFVKNDIIYGNSYVIARKV
ncbi:MAG: class I SAM-dependent methyltransferase [Patescibacteria group bacterium]